MVFEESESLELEPLMNEITEETFYDFLYMQNNIIDLIEEKTKELSMILYDRLPEGEMCDVDIFEFEFRSGRIFVEFEEYRYGESNRDQFELPIRFLYDSDYPVVYKEQHEEKIRLLQRKQNKIDIKKNSRKNSVLEILKKINILD